MRFLFISRLFAPVAPGGYELNCQRQAEDLVDRGHSVRVLSKANGTEPSVDDVGKVQVLRVLPDVARFPAPGLWGRRLYQSRIAQANRLAARLTRDVISQVRPDLVMFWGMNMFILSPILEVSRAGVPYVFDVGDYWLLDGMRYFAPKNWVKRTYRQLLLGGKFQPHLIRHAIVHSEYMLQRYRMAGIAERSIEVIHRPLSQDFLETKQDQFLLHGEDEARNRKRAPSVDNDRLPGRKAAPKASGTAGSRSELRLLYVGRLVPDKGVHLAVEALRELGETPGTPISLEIFGDGFPEYIEDLRRQVKTVGGRCSVVLREQQPHAEMLRIYQNHDVLLFPVTWEEPSSNVLVEATAAGLPVISARSGSVEEFLENGVNACFVDKQDVRGLMHAILHMEASLEDYQQEAKRLAAGMIRRHRPERVFERTEDFLLKVHAELGNSARHT